MNPTLLLAADTVTFETSYVAAAIGAALLCYFGIQHILGRKEEVDVFQENAARAGAVAVQTGFKHLDDLLFAVAGGSLRRVKNIVKFLYNEYCSTERGPVKLARDVFMATWPKLRDDAEYGNEVREMVVATALGFDPKDQRKDLEFAQAGGRLEKIGWTKSAKAAMALGVKDFRAMTEAVSSLANEVLENNGEKEIALRVARPTIDVLFNDPTYRTQVMPLLREYVEKDDARIAAEEAKAVEKAKALLAQGATTT